MQLVLCAATEFEIAPTLSFLKENKYDVPVVITGVGLTAATYAITKAAIQLKPQFMLQAGIGGSLNKHLALGTTVAVATETIGDLGVWEGQDFRSLFQMGFAQPDQRPFSNGLLKNEHSIVQQCGLPLAGGITVNEISTNAERIAHYQKTYEVGVESMEGAALHYVCLMENIPFLQLRSLSNHVGERDKNKWQMKASIASLNENLIKLIKTFYI